MKKDQEIDTSSDISHLSKRTPKDGERTERAWYLIWKAADRCLLKVGHSAAAGARGLLAAGRSPNLVPRAFSSTIFKMADRREKTIRHFENRRGEGPGDEVGRSPFRCKLF